MRTTGIVRKIDELGRIVIPSDIRRELGLGERDLVEIAVERDAIVIRRFEPACVFCGSREDLFEYRGKTVCRRCAQALCREAGNPVDADEA
ncbi:AbrB/MazE/SpoVT family DNA-binding domain-containing protein [Brockia lithotrophica]|uniref:AbrB family transcriptional regulator n=1 Tax=Brockia lithotrophica TaxID=933949 RepID=A0A660KZ65_9BACL|nr:AbrB/MazE/SpoVT family DNA-binding domain-containing protein [Brockia lithotrophica]RKQ85647.1 AbrB family transcriptional regulator [Brockia lithotrophica]